MAHRSDQDRIEKTHNLPRFFVEHPQVSWVLLVGVLVGAGLATIPCHSEKILIFR